MPDENQDQLEPNLSAENPVQGQLFNENFVYKTPQVHYRLHLEQSTPPITTKNEPGHHLSLDHHRRGLKEIIQDAGRQIAASLIILAIGFLLLNFSAYSKIVKNKWNELWGIESPLNQIIEKGSIVYTKQVLETSSDPDVQKKQIPALNLEIAPFDNRIIIPRIDQNIPLIKVGSDNLIKKDWGALESQIQEALKDGVVHYPGTSLPGQTGNTVITGHSSYFPWDPGRFKDVFALLHKVVVGDKLVIYYQQDKYVYEVTNIKIVTPEQIEVLKQTPEEKLTLITCTPVGTNLKRLVVVAKPVSKNDIPVKEKIVR